MREVEAELLQHLVSPLDLKRGGADHKDAVGAVAEQQLEDDHARLDRLAEAHVVRDEQVDAGHLDGANHGVELVVFDVDAAAKRRLELARVGDRSGPPPDRIEERFEMSWLVETLGLG